MEIFIILLFVGFFVVVMSLGRGGSSGRGGSDTSSGAWMPLFGDSAPGIPPADSDPGSHHHLTQPIDAGGSHHLHPGSSHHLDTGGSHHGGFDGGGHHSGGGDAGGFSGGHH